MARAIALALLALVPLLANAFVASVGSRTHTSIYSPIICSRHILSPSSSARGDDDGSYDDVDGNDYDSGPRLPAQLRRYAAQEFEIGRFVAALGVAEVTEWEYNQRVNTLDPTTPTRTTAPVRGQSVRFFEGYAYDGTRVLLKEFPSRASASLAASEANCLVTLRERWDNNQRAAVEAANEARAAAAAAKEKAIAEKGVFKAWWDTLGADEAWYDASDDFNTVTSATDEVLDRIADEQAPFVGLRGGIDADSTILAFSSREFDKGWRRVHPEVQPPTPGGVWLVYKWEGFGNSFGRWPRQTRDWSPSDALRPSKRLSRRGTFLKAAMCASLSSVAFLHEAGYVHRSLSPSSFLLSQVNDDDDAAAFSLLGRLASRTISNSISNNMNGGDSRSNTDADAPIDDGVLRSLNQGGGLRVKLTDFGFAATLMDAASDPVLRKRCGPQASPFDRTARATAEDLEALGFVWLELVFSSLALSREAPPGPPSDVATFQRLYSDVFDRDIRQLRDYCAQESAFAASVALLDTGTARDTTNDKSIGKSEGRVEGGSEIEPALGEGWLLIETLLGVQRSLSSTTSRLSGRRASDEDVVGGGNPKEELRKNLTARELLQSPFFEMK